MVSPPPKHGRIGQLLGAVGCIVVGLAVALATFGGIACLRDAIKEGADSLTVKGLNNGR